MVGFLLPRAENKKQSRWAFGQQTMSCVILCVYLFEKRMRLIEVPLTDTKKPFQKRNQ